MTRGRSAMGVVIVVSALFLTACSSVPSTSDVRKGREVRFEQEEPFVRALAQDPQEGAEPLDIVKGFLSASASVDEQVARNFLAPEARTWRPFTKITVYDDVGVDIRAVPGDQVAMRAPVRAVIDAEGVYQVAAPGSELRVEFKLRRHEGQWRISNIPDGLLVSPTDVERAFRSVNLYFTDPTLNTLVPDPIVLPIRDRFETRLVDRLLQGPTARLEGSVGSGFGSDTDRRGPVVIENSVATVNLEESVADANEAERRAMAAQLVATLRQLPDVSDVAFQVAGADVRLPGVSQPMARDAWPTFDTDVVPDEMLAAFRDDLGIRSLADEGTVTSVPGAAGIGTVALRFPAMGLDGDNRVAGLDAGRSNLLVGLLAADQPITPRLSAPDLTPPSWDGTGAVWVASGPANGPSAAWVIRDGQQPLAVELPPEMSAGSIAALRVARDGTRVAVVVRAANASRLFLGRIERSAAATSPVALRGVYEVDPALTEVLDASWQDSGSLAVLMSDGSGLRQVTVVTVDGFRTLPVSALPDAISIAAAPGDRLLAATADGRLFRYSGAAWEFLRPGAEPAYPG
ncbi:MAG TPA: LpqB family beta-propeller domain-containing protein [Actinomycetes bacterium]|nr:LpqB family beta-propeller domain-containing protein [Actinomycetes bacterium]